jgi:hypothetical protein
LLRAGTATLLPPLYLVLQWTRLMKSHDEFWADYMIHAHDEAYHGKHCSKNVHDLGPRQVDEARLWTSRALIWVLSK